MEANDIPDVQLKELIDAIQRDGIDKSRQEGDALLGKAREQADAILAAAHSQADALLADARREQEQLERAGRESLKQAARNVMLAVRSQLQALFSALLKERSSQVLESKEITAAMAAMIASWTPEFRDRVELLLPPARREPLTQALRSALAGKLAAGIEIKAAAEVTNGFRVAEKNGQAFYDFSAASIAESLSLYLNPVMDGIVAEALRQDAAN
jgi:V/A-type H+-transporting ATPase subunit E